MKYMRFSSGEKEPQEKRWFVQQLIRKESMSHSQKHDEKSHMKGV